MSPHYIGLMSGTSMDGVDGVLTRLSPQGGIQVLAHAHRPFPPALRDELFALNHPGHNEIERGALAGNALAHRYAEVVQSLKQACPGTPVRAIGAHGQTVRHRPGEFDGTGFTTQLFNGALLAELSGIDVVCDFRSRDVAAGGQGAPLVPAFHQAVFGQGPDGGVAAVVNIGGISNVSLLDARSGGQLAGHDCGPGNCLMDAWIQAHHGQPYDADGAWAAQGHVLPELLQAMLAEPYFSLPPPKSTGRDLFHPDWLQAKLDQHTALTTVQAAAQDVQATLAELTARSIALSLVSGNQNTRPNQTLLVCGGGALNGHLMGRLRAALPGWTIAATDTQGLPAMQVEAAAFAWLAMRFMERLPGNEPRVTGASGPRVLGALYPA